MEATTNTAEDIPQTKRVKIRRQATTEDELKKDIEKLGESVTKLPDTQTAIVEDAAEKGKENRETK